MSSAAIFDAFAIAAGQLAADLSLPIAYPDVEFVPPVGVNAVWLELAFFPNETTNYGVGNVGVPKGFAQLTVAARKGAGLVLPLGVVASAILYFAKGSIMGPSRVEREPWASSVIQQDDKTLTPITIPYRGDKSADPDFVDGGDSGDNLQLILDGGRA